jgi:hypothetical protein
LENLIDKIFVSHQANRYFQQHRKNSLSFRMLQINPFLPSVCKNKPPKTKQSHNNNNNNNNEHNSNLLAQKKETSTTHLLKRCQQNIPESMKLQSFLPFQVVLAYSV